MPAVERIAPAFEGLDTESSPDYVAKYKSPELSNFLVNRPGKLLLRGGLTQSRSLDTGNTRAHGMWTFGETVLVNVDGTNTVSAAVTDGTVAAGSTVSTDSTLAPADVFCRVGDTIYGPAATGGPTKMLSWVFGSPAAVANAPRDAADVAEFGQRLMVLGGTAPGTTTPVIPHALWWTDTGGPDAGTTADWEDDLSGLVNRISLPTAGVGLARLGQSLVIFHRNSVALLHGTSPTNWTVRSVLKNRGLIHRRGKLELGDAVLFLSNDGLYHFDGSECRLVSEPVQTPLVEAINYGGVMVPAMNYLTGGYVHVVLTSFGLEETVVFSKLLHLASGAWVDVTIDEDVSPIGLVRLANTDSQAVAWDCNRLWLTDGMTHTRAWDTRRFVDINGATVRAVAGRWVSRVAALASPSHKAQVRRVLIDYTANILNGDDGWHVTVLDESGTVLLAEFQLPFQPVLTPLPNRQRHEVEIFAEATAVQVQIEWRGADGSITDGDVPSLFDVTVEYEPAQQT